jgi:PAP2 superfamily
MSERSWLLPALVLTFISGAAALLIMPNYSGVMPALRILPLWMFVSGSLASIYAYASMAAARVRSPFREIARAVCHEWRYLLTIAVGITVAGLNMIAFMWTKPLLNYFIPFWADPVLARFDRALFLGHDPWTLLTWLNSNPTAIFYHRGWFALMIITLLVVLSRPASPQKSAILLTYFILWSIVGPVIHLLMPAAGPVFFDKLGYGTEFAGIWVPHDMVDMTNYLWTVYKSNQFFAPGSGISAMPSLHIATTTWMVIAIYVHARRLIIPVAVSAILILLLSISLGWHYAADGIIGGAMAFGCYALTLRMYDGRLALPRPVRGAFAVPLGRDAPAAGAALD